MKYGYIRVSSKKQDETRQIKALLNIGISKEKIFSDKSSGNKRKRKLGKTYGYSSYK